MQDEAPNEGWQAEKPYSQRVYHYMTGTFSLCSKLGFYMGELMPDTGKPGREDCKACLKKLATRNAKAALAASDSTKEEG